jgi:ketosteroid isomerase-like protein
MGKANEELVRKGYEAFNQGDMEALGKLMAPDVVHEIPGNNPTSGAHKGWDEVVGVYGTIAELTEGSYSAALKSVTATGDDTVVAVHQSTGRRAGKSLDVEETITFTITDGKIDRLESSFADQAAVDEFWA